MSKPEPSHGFRLSVSLSRTRVMKHMYTSLSISLSDVIVSDKSSYYILSFALQHVFTRSTHFCRGGSLGDGVLLYTARETFPSRSFTSSSKQ